MEIRPEGAVSNWRVAYGAVDADNPEPLFVACANHAATCSETERQPITVKPQVSRADMEMGGMMIFFGTGKFFEEGDNLSGDHPQIQSFYGLRDRNTDPEASADQIRGTDNLVERFILSQTQTVGSTTVRVTSADDPDHPVDYSTKRGWFMDLKLKGQEVGTGERVVANPVYHDGRITFDSFVPVNTPCSYGGMGWLMELDANTGSRVGSGSPLFDPAGKNGGAPEGKLDSSDLTSYNNQEVAPSGVQLGGIPSSTRIIRDSDSIYRITSLSNSTTDIRKGPQAADINSRISWEQLL